MLLTEGVCSLLLIFVSLNSPEIKQYDCQIFPNVVKERKQDDLETIVFGLFISTCSFTHC